MTAGAGSAARCWRSLSERIRAEGRTNVIGYTSEPLDGPATPGVLFAGVVGAERALDEICRSLELDDVSDEQLAALEDDASEFAAGYELVQWVRPVFRRHRRRPRHAPGRMSTDTPLGDLDWEPEAWDRERYRESEELSCRLGRRCVTTAARHVASGRVVAYSDLGWSSRDRAHGLPVDDDRCPGASRPTPRHAHQGGEPASAAPTRCQASSGSSPGTRRATCT